MYHLLNYSRSYAVLILVIVFLGIYFLQYLDLFTCNSKRYLSQIYLAYCFIIIQVSWLIILCIPLLQKTIPVFVISGQFDVKNAKIPGFSALPKLPVFRCHGAAFWRILVTDNKTEKQNFLFFDLCREINNKSNRLYKSISIDLLEKDWWFCFSTLKDPTSTYYGII